MQTSVGGGLANPAPPERAPRRAAGIARGAMLVAGLTIVSRLFGLVRTLVFSQTVGATCLGSAYVTASQVPNLIYELVLGGALTSAMIPVLARSAERADADPAERQHVSQITSALLTWSVAILVPLSVAIAAAAMPIASLLNPVNGHEGCSRDAMVDATGHMLVVFAPQALLYGLSVVLYGLLQAYRRFTGPTLGPALSSLVVIAACLAFVPLGKGLPLSQLPLSAQLVLSVGTTLGIAALVVAGAIPTWRLHLRLRPTWVFPPGVARRAGGLALVGIVEIVFVDLASLVTITLANGRGSTGAIVIFNYASQVFNSVSAVLALSVTVSAFPVLAARDGPEFDEISASSTRAVSLLSWLGTAAMVAVAIPAGQVLARQSDQVSALVVSFVLFAPGIAAVALITNLSRVMFVVGRLKIAAAALGGSWLAVIAASVTLTEMVPVGWVAPALALGNTVGQIAVAIPLVFATRRICGPAVLRGFGHANLSGFVACLVGAGVGVAVCVAAPSGGKLMAFAAALVAAVLAAVVFGAVAYLLDRGDLKTVVARLRRVVRPRPS